MTPRRIALALVILLGVAAAPLLRFAAADTKTGALVLIGGGDTPPDVVSRTLALAGGAKAEVVVIGQASEAPDAGERSAQMWREAGAQRVVNLSLEDVAAARAAIDRATLIWMPGGDQARLVRRLEAAELTGAIRKRFAEGAIVGGTSAGAAAVSTAMMTGDADEESITAGATVLAPGLGLLEYAIVDQHALKRRRLNRLVAAVLDRPDLVGLAVDESTAALIFGRRIEVMGRTQVVVIDGRQAARIDVRRGEAQAATGIVMHVLRAGMKLELAR
jgi:cyanophycinase